MARERTVHDTQHTAEDDWPLILGINDRGQSMYVCADCDTEIPDGACVERRNGKVVAWLPDGTDSPKLLHSCRKRGRVQ